VLEIERLAEARARQGATVDQGSVGGGDGDSETVLPRRLDDTKGAVGLRSALNRAVLTAATRWRFAFLRLAMIMAPAISSNTTNTTNIPNTRNICAVAASGNLALSLPRGFGDTHPIRAHAAQMVRSLSHHALRRVVRDPTEVNGLLYGYRKRAVAIKLFHGRGLIVAH